MRRPILLGRFRRTRRCRRVSTASCGTVPVGNSTPPPCARGHDRDEHCSCPDSAMSNSTASVGECPHVRWIGRRKEQRPTPDQGTPPPEDRRGGAHAPAFPRPPGEIGACAISLGAAVTPGKQVVAGAAPLRAGVIERIESVAADASVGEPEAARPRRASKSILTSSPVHSCPGMTQLTVSAPSCRGRGSAALT